MALTGDSTHKQHIVEYLKHATRNRLVFCHEPIEGLSFLNLGKVLATALASEDLRSPMIAYAAEDTLSGIPVPRREACCAYILPVPSSLPCR